MPNDMLGGRPAPYIRRTNQFYIADTVLLCSEGDHTTTSRSKLDSNHTPPPQNDAPSLSIPPLLATFRVPPAIRPALCAKRKRGGWGGLPLNTHPSTRTLTNIRESNPLRPVSSYLPRRVSILLTKSRLSLHS
jgi:hypothetical protein